MPKKAESHIQNSAPGPPTEIAPVTPMMLPGPTRMAELKKKAAKGEMPISVCFLCAMVNRPRLNSVICTKPRRRLKYTPEPIKRIMAKEKFPKIGIEAYHFMFVGKSHKKSDKGPMKLKIPLIAAKIASIKYPSSQGHHKIWSS